MQMYIVSMEYPTTDQFWMFSSNVDAKLIKDQDIMVFIHPGAGWAVVLVNHALAIKESSKHDLTSTFLLWHFLQSQLTLMQPDE